MSLAEPIVFLIFSLFDWCVYGNLGFLRWYMKYFASASNNGPVEAFYASFMPDVQRANKLDNLIQTTDWAKSFQG